MTRWLMLAGLLALAAPAAAEAQQPLATFLDAIEEHDPSLRAAAEDARAASARTDEARYTLLPRFSAFAGYQRNESQVSVQRQSMDGTTQTSLILPYDQLDAWLQLDVPLVDLSAWTDIGALEHDEEASRLARRAALRRAKLQVIAGYYRLVASRSVVDAANERVRVADAGRAVVAERVAAGTSPALELARADVEIGLARDAVSQGLLEVALAERALVAWTGVTPTDAHVELAERTSSTPSLEVLRTRIASLPSVRAANETAEAARRRRESSWQDVLPTLRGFARQRWTNAAGFQPESLWSIGVGLNWVLEPRALMTHSAREHEASAAEARMEAIALAEETALVEAYRRVESGRTHLATSRVTVEASLRAVADIRERFEVARATQLEVLIAEREEFDARVTESIARAELAMAEDILAALIADSN